MKAKILDKQTFEQLIDLVNTQGNYCGTYCCAVLLSYFQKHFTPAILPDFLQENTQQGQASLVEILKLLVQPFGFPTLPIELSMGLNRFFRRYQMTYRAHSTTMVCLTRIKKRIDAGLPLIVGLSKKRGSSYGNHWVVCYGYLQNEDGSYDLLVHDVWGNPAKIIPAKWVNSTVSIKR